METNLDDCLRVTHHKLLPGNCPQPVLRVDIDRCVEKDSIASRELVYVFLDLVDDTSSTGPEDCRIVQLCCWTVFSHERFGVQRLWRDSCELDDHLVNFGILDLNGPDNEWLTRTGHQSRIMCDSHFCKKV